jgi:hypothetical protein
MEKKEKKDLTIQQRLIEVQTELKVPKGNYNSFGKYKYRSAEDILEAVKPLLKKHEVLFTITDDIIQIGNKMFIKAFANICYNNECISVNGFAEIGEHKGMSVEQCIGTASSYARKYAMNGLFLIDETEADPDHDNKKQEVKKDLPELPQNKADDVIDFLINKSGTLEQVQKKYKLNETQIEYFNNIIKSNK